MDNFCYNICDIFLVMGIEIIVKSWLIEVFLWMLMNNLYFDVVENLYELVVYGGIGCVVWMWKDFDLIVDVLCKLEDDQILMV